MKFYVLLLLTNFLCFAPLYLLSMRDHPNPFALAPESMTVRSLLMFFYVRFHSPDPFRINFDFSFAILTLAAFGIESSLARSVIAVILCFGFIEILYTAVMETLFKRAPVLQSDISLIRAGLAIAQWHRYWILPGVVLLILVIGAGAYFCTSILFSAMPSGSLVPLFAAFCLLPSAFHHWRSVTYRHFVYRVVYSPLLHLIRNLEFSTRLKSVLSRDAEFFRAHNYFRELEFRNPPDVILICVESYGSIAHRDDRYGVGLAEMLSGYEKQLANRGFQMASTYSEAPIYAGGSWLSYTSFTYGILLDDIRLHDLLFAHDHAFGAYESIFHVLKRNGYENTLLCPLGGIDEHTIDWAMITRCFQSDRKIAFDDLRYQGPLVNYFGVFDRHSAPDQFALNFAYETIVAPAEKPQFLFFCTLNSHHPWYSPLKPAADWRSLNDPRYPLELSSKGDDIVRRCSDAIRYQLDYVLRFVVERAAENSLVIVFGDHQPPLITPERMGKHTPVHVIGRKAELTRVFYDEGFAPALSLAGHEPVAIKHEGFLSLLLKGMQAAYGTNHTRVDYRATGVPLFDGL